MPWATAETVRPLLAADLGEDPTSLAAAWDGRLTLALTQARREIETALDARAYTPGQIASVDWLQDEHTELTLVAALLKGGSLTNYDIGAVERRYERIVARIKTQVVYIGGVPVFPARQSPDGQPLSIAGGTLAGAADAYGTGREAYRKIDPNEGY
jgi:hypothetical protein